MSEDKYALLNLPKNRLEYLGHNVGYCSIIVKLWSKKSIVLDMTSTSEDSEVLLFDLVDGPGKPNFFADEKATNLDAIRIYIRRGDDIFMFENRLPNVFRKCFEQKNVPIGDPTKDILWYSSFISPETELIKIE